MQLSSRVTLPLVLAIALGAPALHAQSYEQAVDAYKAGNYEDAATLFYGILRFEDDPGVLAEAQYGLARSYFELGLHVAALKYYEDIIKDGSDHPYFDKAVEGLLEIADKVKDDLKIPPVIDGMYEPNFDALRKMSVSNADTLERIHYTIGRYSFNRGDVRGAEEFLGTVKEGNLKYPHAQYLLGLIGLGVGRPDNPEPQYKAALKNFANVRRSVPFNTQNTDLRELRDLATLGLGRTYYEMAAPLEDGDPERAALLSRAIREYRSIPRFSEAWADSMFERAWAHTLNNEYGKALGALHNLRAPYFQERFYPEANILKAIVYYYNCQWDRVNVVLDETKARYEPLVERMNSLAEKDLDFPAWYSLLNDSLDAGIDHGNPELIPWRVANHIARDAKFQKMEVFLRQLEKEAVTFERSPVFAKSEMGREMTDFALDTRDAFLQVVGKYVKTKVIGQAAQLSDITTRAAIISLETKTAEGEWLEQGRTIEGAERGVLPRPFVPDDTFQFWWFRDEYWIDELGFFESVIKSECYQ